MIGFIFVFYVVIDIDSYVGGLIGFVIGVGYVIIVIFVYGGCVFVFNVFVLVDGIGGGFNSWFGKV